MFWIDFAIAGRRDAERAFFDFEGASGEDDIPRLQVADFSDFELAHLGMLLCDGYSPALVLDGDAPDEIITACDPRLVAALAALPETDLALLAERWRANSGLGEANSILPRLQAFARRAQAAGLPLLYAQGDDQARAPDED